MNERIFQSEFTKWAKQHIKTSTAFELKVAAKDGNLYYKQIKEHQIESLRKAKHHVVVHKISDMALGFKPFDCVALADAQAFIAVMFYKPYMKHTFILIDIDDMVKEMSESRWKYITKDRANEIGIEITL